MAPHTQKRGKKKLKLIQKPLDHKAKQDLMKLFEEALPRIDSLTKARNGRPSVMTEERLAKLRFAFVMGCSDNEACLLSGINKASLYRYQSKHPEFCDQKVQLKNFLKLRARMTILRNINDVKVAKWYLEKNAHNEFSRNRVQ